MIFTMFIAWFYLGMIAGRWLNRRTIYNEMEKSINNPEDDMNLCKYLTLQKLFNKL